MAAAKWGFGAVLAVAAGFSMPGIVKGAFAMFGIAKVVVGIGGIAGLGILALCLKAAGIFCGEHGVATACIRNACKVSGDSWLGHWSSPKAGTGNGSTVSAGILADRARSCCSVSAGN